MRTAATKAASRQASQNGNAGGTSLRSYRVAFSKRCASGELTVRSLANREPPNQADRPRLGKSQRGAAFSPRFCHVVAHPLLRGEAASPLNFTSTARPLSPRQLSGVRVLARIEGANAPPGYPYALVTKGIFVREGGVAVDCGNEHDGKIYDTVTFVVPRVYKLDLDTTSPW